MVAMVLVCAPTSLARVRTFLLIGQSNMEGYGEWDEADFTEPLPFLPIWSFGGASTHRWLQMGPGFGAKAGLFGPEITLATTLHEAFSEDTLGFIKVGWGGTNLDEEWLSPSSGGPGHTYQALVESWEAADGSWPFGFSGLVEGVFWMQGESDAMDSGMASRYRENFTVFVQDVRKLVKNPAVPWVTGLIDVQTWWVHADTVRKAQVDVAASDRNMVTVETVGLETNTVHYTAQGQKDLGILFAKAWLKLAGYKIPVSVPPKASDGSSSGLARIPDHSKVRAVSVDGSLSSWEDFQGTWPFPPSLCRLGCVLQVRPPSGEAFSLRVSPSLGISH